MFKVKQFISVIKIDNILDSYRDKLEFPINRDWFKKVICKQKERLINNSEVINSTINIIDDIIREAVEIAITVLLEQVSAQLSYKEKSFNMKKKLDSFDVIKFDRIFKEEMIAMNVMNHPRLWSVMGVSYGQGMERGLSDLGKSPEQLPWHEFRETKAYQQKLWGTLKHITNGLSDRVRGVVAVGVADGLSPYMIARRLRDIKLGPKKVFVNPKIVDGVQVRKGYSYIISDKRYAEMIARTESARALTEGRVDAYRRGGIKQVQWLSAGDSRVCEECMDLDGRIFPINEAPIVPLHISCRCDKVSAGLTEPSKIQGVDIADDFSRNNFTSSSILSKEAFKTEIASANSNYLNLSTLQRKKVLRTMLKDYKKIGATPIVDANNIDDLMRAFHLSKSINKIDPNILSAIKRASGTKPTNLFIGENAVNKKFIRLNEFFQTPTHASAYSYDFFESVKNASCGGLCRPVNLGHFRLGKLKSWFKLGQDRNVIYLSSYQKGLEVSSFIDGIQTSHFGFHELSHLVMKNSFTEAQVSKWGGLFNVAKTNPISSFAKYNADEYFAEALAAKATGSTKLIHSEIEKFIQDFIKYKQ